MQSFPYYQLEIYYRFTVVHFPLLIMRFYRSLLHAVEVDHGEPVAAAV